MITPRCSIMGKSFSEPQLKRNAVINALFLEKICYVESM